MSRLVSLIGFVGVVGLVGALAQPAQAEAVQAQTPPQPILGPHTAVVPVTLPGPPPTIVNSHILYLNNCRPNGCKIVRDSYDDARINHSSIAPSSGTITALKSTIDFTTIENCVKTALAPFNISVVDVDPGAAVDHFEMIIAGSPTDLGFDPNNEGVAPYLCTGVPGQCGGSYIPNAITFAFANAYPQTTLMCGVALQETAHGWTLDHATLSNDPMTYKTYSTPLSYHDGAPCGSDCLYNNGTTNAFGVTCSGTNQNGTHMCMETGTASQNEIQIITNLFGPAGAQAPTLSITPITGTAEQLGTAWPVVATCTSPDGIKEIDLYIDDILDGMATSSPATLKAPMQLLAGTHHVKVVCGTNKQATAVATADVIIGNVCAVDSDCGANKICYQMACIDGPGGAGGLGAACTTNTDCKSGQCGDDGQTQECVIACVPSNNQCPAGFDCLDNGAGGGVCWLSSGSGGGCCEAQRGSDPRGAIVFGLGFAALWITRRNRK